MARVEASAIWEDSDRPPLDLFVDADTSFADALWPDPNAFVLAALLPAWHAAERRLRIEGRLCPVLRDHLKAATMTLASWYPDGHGPVPAIEPAGGFDALRPTGMQAASLLSCGIDSLATLRSSQLNLPRNHPSSIRAGIMVAFDDHPEPSQQRLVERSSGRLAAGRSAAADCGISLIAVRTNLWWLDTDGYFFSDTSHGAIFSAVASFFSRGFRKSYIASSYDARSLRPWGSHPLLDPCYSSAHFQIEHHGTHMSRSEKIAFVADWPAGLQSIRVCQNDASGTANCGTCRKCIKTMTVLLALNKLQECQAFPHNDVTAALLESMGTYGMIDSPDQVGWCRGLVPIFQRQGRNDLASALERLANSSAPILAAERPIVPGG